MALSCPLATIQCRARKSSTTAIIVINPLVTKIAQSRWLDIGQVPFLCVYGPRQSRGPYIILQKKRLANVQPS